MKQEAPQPINPPNIYETFEEALDRLNKDGIFSPEEIERAKKLHKSIEELEESQRKCPPRFWNKIFSLVHDAEQYKQGNKKINSPREIHSENRIDVDELQKNIQPVFDEMKVAEERIKKDARIPKEAMEMLIDS